MKMSVETVRSRARLLMWLVTLPLIALALGALFMVIAVAGTLPAGAAFIQYLPMFIYVWAIWMVRQTLKSIASGARFDSVVPKLLFRIGLALFCGALFEVFGVQNLWRLFYGFGTNGTFDGAAITLGVVGAALVLIAQLISQAREMHEELDQFV